MANLIPNENTWVGFIPGTTEKPDGVANLAAPTTAEMATAIDLTDYLISLTASSSGNTVPTPRLKRLFETNIPGTSAATFTADFYRDDENDLAWTTLYRGRRGSFIVSRFGGKGTDKKPIVGDIVETWPSHLVSRAAAALSSGTAQMFTLTGAVPKEPDEGAVISA